MWTLRNFPIYGDLDFKLKCFVPSSLIVKLASTAQKERKLGVCCLGEEKCTIYKNSERLFSTSSHR